MKKKTNISDKALKLINKKQIKPIPKWEFVVKNWGLWLGFGICLILLVLGVGVSWFGLAGNIIIPYIWLFIAVIFLVLSFLLFEKTKKAYRLNKSLVLIFIIIIAITIGGIIFKTGMANRIDKGLGARSIYYRQMVPIRIQAWSNPEQGYLSGIIINLTNNNKFEIKDFSGNIWKITGQNPLIRGRVVMDEGQEIKLIGTQTNGNNFIVDEIRPWNGMGQNMMKEN